MGLAAGGDVAALSVREIAAAVGVSEGLLYHYFPTKESLVVAAVQRAADALVRALDDATGGAPWEALNAGLAAYLDHVQRDPVGWKAVLSARGGDLASIGDAVERHSRRLLLASLGVRSPTPTLTAALDGWAAYERATCLTWLDQPGLSRGTVEDLLESSFVAALQAAGRHDRQAGRVLIRLGIG